MQLFSGGEGGAEEVLTPAWARWASESSQSPSRVASTPRWWDSDPQYDTAPKQNAFNPAAGTCADLEEEVALLSQLAVATGFVAYGPSQVGELEVEVRGVDPDSQGLDDGERVVQLGPGPLVLTGGLVGDDRPGQLVARLRLVEPGAADRHRDGLLGAGAGPGQVALAGLGSGADRKQQRAGRVRG